MPIPLPQRLRSAELYLINQGDKFHPLSDTLRALFREAEAEVQDSCTSYEPSAEEADALELEEAERLLAAVEGELTRYEEHPPSQAARYHSYHIGRLREKLDPARELD